MSAASNARTPSRASRSHALLRSPDWAIVSTNSETGDGPPKVSTFAIGWTASAAAPRTAWAAMAAGACVLSWIASAASRSGPIAERG